MKYIKEYMEHFGEEDWDWEEDFPENNEHQIIKDIDKDFYDFLIDEGVFDQYIKNFNNRKYIKDFLIHNHFSSYIKRAFAWNYCDDNIDWKLIHQKWMINQNWRIIFNI